MTWPRARHAAMSGARHRTWPNRGAGGLAERSSSSELSRADISSCLAPDLAERDVWLYSSAGHGSPEAKTVEVAPRQAACAASSPGAARERVPGLPPAEAAAPRLPELQDVPRARSRAAENPGALGRSAFR